MLFYVLVGLPLLLMAVGPVVLIVMLARGGRHDYHVWLRRRRGECIHCGYDLRATPDRCPECGNLHS